MLELKDRQIAAVKRQFRNSLPAIKKIESLNKKIAELIDERDREQAYLDGGEAGIKALTGGYASYELIHCEYVPQFNEDGTPKMDKDGKYQLKKQVLTFVPPTEPAMPEAGNDYDTDACQCDSCGCTSCSCDMEPLNEEEYQKLQELVNEAKADAPTLHAEELENGPFSTSDEVSTELPANDNTSTEA